MAANNATTSARWQARLNRAFDFYRQSVQTNLQQLQSAGARASKGSYGTDDWIDDARELVARSFRDGIDVLRVAWGFPTSSDELPVIEAEFEVGSQSSGPIVFSIYVDQDVTLKVNHLHRILDGEMTAKLLTSSNFVFSPATLTAADPPKEIELEIVGLNQITRDDALVNEVARGKYVGFVLGHGAKPFDLLAVLVLTVVDPRLPTVDMT